MTDISNALKSTMRQEHCSSLYALLFLKGENRDDEWGLHQFEQPTKCSEYDEKWEHQTDGKYDEVYE